MTEIAFTVLGRPQTAGSKKAFAHRTTGRIIVTDDNKRSKPWMQAVAAEAYNHVDELLDGPLELEVTFYLVRPKGHYGSGKNSATVKASAPAFPATRPDTTKLLRAVEDALTGVAYRDDGQIVDQVARKRFGAPERAEIVVRRAA